MKTFEWKRFSHMLRHELITNKSSLLRIALCMFICFFAIEEVFMLLLHENANGAAILIMTLCFWVWTIGMQYSASKIVRNLENKASAITFLMQPASNLEKFITRWIYVTVVWGVVSALAFVAADVASWAFNSMIWMKDASAIQPILWRTAEIAGKIIDEGIQIPIPAYKGMIMMALATIWGHSCYILGGTIFRRHHFIFSLLSMYILQMVMSMGFFIFFGKYDEIQILEFALTSYTQMAVLTVLTVFNYLAAYRIFTRSEVIGSRYVNATLSMFKKQK